MNVKYNFDKACYPLFFRFLTRIKKSDKFQFNVKITTNNKLKKFNQVNAYYKPF